MGDPTCVNRWSCPHWIETLRPSPAIIYGPSLAGSSCSANPPSSYHDLAGLSPSDWPSPHWIELLRPPTSSISRPRDFNYGLVPSLDRPSLRRSSCSNRPPLSTRGVAAVAPAYQPPPTGSNFSNGSPSTSGLVVAPTALPPSDQSALQ